MHNEPLRRGETVLFSNLDFSRFEESDLDELNEKLERRLRMTGKLEKLNEVFCKAEAVSVSKRAYC